jgi:ribosomal protein S18 acetylase RimI-like enzyme
VPEPAQVQRPFSIAENLREALGSYALASDGGFVESAGGFTLISSGVSYPTFNATLLSKPCAGADRLERMIRCARARYSALRLPWSFWLCEDLLDSSAFREAGRLFGKEGLRLVAEYQGMLTERLLPPRSDLPALRIERVSHAGTRLDFLRLMSEVFDLPDQVASAVYGGERYWSGSMVAWVGYLGNRPVSSAATATAAGAVGVYSVGTLPGLRRRGYAETMTRFALNQAWTERGPDLTILQATGLGSKLYRAMGYRAVSRISVYVAN